MPEILPNGKVKIDATTLEWEPQLDTDLPIWGSDLPDFAAWVNWNGYEVSPSKKEHGAFDFAAYLTTQGDIVLGLPENTPIRAVADGYVKHTGIEMDTTPYEGYVELEHNPDDRGMISWYLHVVPNIGYRQKVKKGDVVGTLYKDPGTDSGRLVHLHLTLFSAMGTRGTAAHAGLPFVKRMDDPRIIDESIYKYNAEPQGNLNFTIAEFPKAKILQAHFKHLKVETSDRRTEKPHEF